jgi:hypothetical protein
MTYGHFVSPSQQQLPLKDEALHDTPYSTNFTEGNTDLTKSLAARVPPIIGNGNRATVPAASTPTGFTLCC